MQLLLMLLFLLLKPHVLLYRLSVQSHRVNTVALHLEMIAPIGPFLEKQKYAEQSFAGNITEIGIGSIAANGKSEILGVLTQIVEDCIKLADTINFRAEGNLTLIAGNGNGEF